MHNQLIQIVDHIPFFFFTEYPFFIRELGQKQVQYSINLVTK